MIELGNYITIPLLSFTLFWLFVLPLIRIARFIKLLDIPNSRKIHARPIPLVGGIAIFISSGLVFMISDEIWIELSNYTVFVVGLIIIFVMGVIDDRIELKPIIKLGIQLLLAHFIFVSGIRIESMYGIFGINDIPIFVQYILNMVVFVGVINAFNLMDGIDGLAAGIAIIVLIAYFYLAIILEQKFIAVLFLSVLGALGAFLRFNISKNNKVFMGDGGSLSLGYLLVVSGMILIQSAKTDTELTSVLSIVIGSLIFPVIDSLRVYYSRIKKGLSPFRADKTHFHHLALRIGYKHKSTSLGIVLFTVLTILLTIIVSHYVSISGSIIVFILIFMLIASGLTLNSTLDSWKNTIKKLENG